MSLQEADRTGSSVSEPDAEDSDIEIRQIYEAEDFGESLTPELREQEERLRAKVDGQG